MRRPPRTDWLFGEEAEPQEPDFDDTALFVACMILLAVGVVIYGAVKLSAHGWRL